MCHRRPVRFLPLLLPLCLLLLAPPLGAKVRSNLIRIEQSGAMSGETSGFQYLQIVANTSEQPLWLTVRQGDGPSACEVTEKIEPKKHGLFRCPVADLKPGKVPVAIAVFADEARTQQLESHREEMRFSRADIRTIVDLAAAVRLPVAYEGVAFSAKLGFGSLFRYLLPTARGKLDVSTSAIEYADGKQTLTISASRIRGVDLFGVRNAPPWVVLIYEESGETKRVGFQPNLNRLDDVGRIMASLQAAAAGAQALAEKVAGETLADALLQRDTERMILLSEKSVAPECASARVVDTKIVEEPSNVAIENLRPVRGNWAERWLVDRCGVQLAYGVKYTTDPQGGTFIAIEKP